MLNRRPLMQALAGACLAGLASTITDVIPIWRRPATSLRRRRACDATGRGAGLFQPGLARAGSGGRRRLGAGAVVAGRFCDLLRKMPANARRLPRYMPQITDCSWRLIRCLRFSKLLRRWAENASMAGAPGSPERRSRPSARSGWGISTGSAVIALSLR